jgi:hypothetical protein
MPPKSLQRVPASTRLPRALVGLVFARKLPFVGELYGFEPDRQRPQVSHSLHRLYFGLTLPGLRKMRAARAKQLSCPRLLSQQGQDTTELVSSTRLSFRENYRY